MPPELGGTILNSDCLVKVIRLHNLKNDSLHLVFYYLTRFLSYMSIEKEWFQLLGTGATANLTQRDIKVQMTLGTGIPKHINHPLTGSFPKNILSAFNGQIRHGTNNSTLTFKYRAIQSNNRLPMNVKIGPFASVKINYNN